MKRLKINLLAICGSPIASGNTEWLLDQSIDEVKKVAEEWNVEIEIEKELAKSKGEYSLKDDREAFAVFNSRIALKHMKESLERK